jgi:nucleoside-diphosphate-sugar epimerase
MEKVLITGANGYLGSSIYRRFSSDKNYAVSKLKGRLENIQQNSLNYDIVIHCAGALRHRKSDLQSSNILGTDRLLKGFINTPKFIYISSKSVYGYSFNGEVYENSIPKPDDDYGKSKYQGELLVLNSKIPSLIIRSGTLYGLSNHNIGPAFPGKALRKLLRGENVILHQPDRNHDYLYVNDASEILFKLVSLGNQWNNIFNISGQIGLLSELVTSLKVYADDKVEICGQIEFEKKPKGNFCKMNLSKIMTVLGDDIFTTKEKVISEMGNYILNGL